MYSGAEVGGDTIQSKYFSAEMDFSLHPTLPVQILLVIQSLIDFHLCQEVAHNSPQPLPRGNNILPPLQLAISAHLSAAKF